MAAFLTFVLFLGSEAGWLQDPLVAGGAIVYIFVTWLITAQLALTPALVIILALEFARVSSFLINVLAGGLCALVVVMLSPLQDTVSKAADFQNGQFELAIISAGFIGGLTHWILAGRKAGWWMRTAPQMPTSPSE